MKISAAMSGSMLLPLMKAITLRSVSRSTAAVKSACLIRSLSSRS
jgi:hypothetical protein